MDEYPETSSPVICEDCGRENGQFFRTGEFDDIVCIDCLMTRRDEWEREQEEEGKRLLPIADPDWVDPEFRGVFDDEAAQPLA